VLKGPCRDIYTSSPPPTLHHRRVASALCLSRRGRRVLARPRQGPARSRVNHVITAPGGALRCVPRAGALSLRRARRLLTRVRGHTVVLYVGIPWPCMWAYPQPTEESADAKPPLHLAMTALRVVVCVAAVYVAMAAAQECPRVGDAPEPCQHRSDCVNGDRPAGARSETSD
jgi:hypothetical protein